MFHFLFPAAVLALISLAPQSALAQPAAPPGAAQQVLPGTGLAQTAPELWALFSAMGLYDILDIMSAEGREAAPGLEADLFPGQGGGAWIAVVASIYATDRMVADLEAAVPKEGFTADMLAQLSDFFDSDLGARIVAGEGAARRAFLDPQIKDAATELARDRAAQSDPRLALLTEFITVNDLVDRNVTGALNSNFAFYLGMSQAGAFADEMPEELMLAEVWGQEAEIRSDTLEWLFAYQLLAYEGLSDDDLRDYIALSQSPAGQMLNAALFAAFDVVFEAVSRDLGRAAAGFVAGQDL
jgi:hypothetical protein